MESFFKKKKRKIILLIFYGYVHMGIGTAGQAICIQMNTNAGPDRQQHNKNQSQKEVVFSRASPESWHFQNIIVFPILGLPVVDLWWCDSFDHEFDPQGQGHA